MNGPNYERLVELLASAEIDARTVDCVLAAADGETALLSHLSGAPAPEHASDEAAGTSAPPAFLESIAVAGFRGVGPSARLQFEPGPGLTLVVGRNGCGKSSFAEALEVVLTGEMLRLAGRTQVWKDGWRNLHDGAEPRIGARFRLDGEADALEVSMGWGGTSKLEEGKRTVTGPRGSWRELAWDAPLTQFRPILSYSELGTMFSSRAAELYEALSAVLGLEEFDALAATLRQVRLGRERSEKEEKLARNALKVELETCDDPRAAVVQSQLGVRLPDATQIRAAAGDVEDGDGDPGLRSVASLDLPTESDLQKAFAELATCEETVRELSVGDGERLAALAGVLEQGLRFHQDHLVEMPADCPLCGSEGRLDEGWVLRAQAELEEVRRRSLEFRDARGELDEAQTRIRQLFPRTVAAALVTAGAAGLLIEAARQAYERWLGLLGASGAELSEAERHAEGLRASLAAVRDQASEIESRREDAWKPLRDRILAWAELAERAARERADVMLLKGGEKWVGGTIVTLRRERLAPVIEGARANWAELRHESNVTLGEVELRKVGSQRFAAFDVAVDGADASAFGVMSQGELSALAISVFLPRAMLPASPFAFMLIDDPVQSMDPAKVDGLARVLAGAAKQRQVIVFTHDERLPEAVRRLGLDARIMRVQRRAESKVEIVASLPPSDRYIGEAFAIAKGDDLPAEVKARVIPGFCRSAIEAACTTRIRRQQLKRGTSHAEIDEQLGELQSLTSHLAAAFEIPINQGQEIAAQVERLGGPEAKTIVHLARKGSHQLLPIDGEDLVRGARRLVKALEG